MRIVAMALVLAPALLLSASEEPWREEIKELMRQTLVATQAPTVADYYRLNTHHAESELGVLLKLCTALGLPGQSDDCSALVARKDLPGTPSLYYCWLREHLGVGRSVNVIGIVARKGTADVPVDVIDVRYGNHLLRFGRPVYELNPELREFATKLLEIDGIKEHTLLRELEPDRVQQLARRCRHPAGSASEATPR